jgi:hypothetical protein
MFIYDLQYPISLLSVPNQLKLHEERNDYHQPTLIERVKIFPLLQPRNILLDKRTCLFYQCQQLRIPLNCHQVEFDARDIIVSKIHYQLIKMIKTQNKAKRSVYFDFRIDQLVVL